MDWNITAGRPVYVQLVEHLELALLTGLWPPGSRVPPVRELAAEAAVNPNTMQRALQELESRGLLQAQRTAALAVGYAHQCRALGLDLAEAQALLAQSYQKEDDDGNHE